MIIPIRCWTCGKPLGHLWEEYQERTQKKGEKAKDALDALGCERYCCRAAMLGQVDLIDTVGAFRKF